MNIVRFFLFLSCNFGLVFSNESEDWIEAQIEREFKDFKKGITFSVIEETLNRGGEFYDRPFLVVIKDNVAYTHSLIKKPLDLLLQHFRLPDMIFVYFNSVGPIHEMRLSDGFSPPILAGSKTNDMYNVILIFHRLVFVMNNHYSLNNVINDVVCNDIEWKEKIDKLFWRGVVTDSFFAKGFAKYPILKTYYNDDFFSPRFNLVKLSSLYSELIDAKFIKRDDWGSSYTDLLIQHGIHGFADFANTREHLKYKYQICLDGISTTEPGLVWRLWSNSCVFKVYSPNIEWFYAGLVPWVHFIPIESDLSDLIEKLSWVKEHEAEVKTIVANAKNFSRQYLTQEGFLLYTYKVLSKYASLQKFSKGDYEKALIMLKNKPQKKHSRSKHHKRPSSQR